MAAVLRPSSDECERIERIPAVAEAVKEVLQAVAKVSLREILPRHAEVVSGVMVVVAMVVVVAMMVMAVVVMVAMVVVVVVANVGHRDAPFR